MSVTLSLTKEFYKGIDYFPFLLFPDMWAILSYLEVIQLPWPFIRRIASAIFWDWFHVRLKRNCVAYNFWWISKTKKLPALKPACKCQWIFCCNGSLCKVMPDVKSTGSGQLNKDKNQDPERSLKFFWKCWHAEPENSLAKSPKIQWGKRFISANYFEKKVRFKLNAPRTKVQISVDKLFKSVQVLNAWAEHMSAKN